MQKTKLEVVEDIKLKLLANINPRTIILFGSVAKGIDKEQSDIDLLVVWDEYKESPNIARRIMIRKVLGITEVPIDIITCSSEELGLAIEDEYSFTSQVLKEGKVIYDRLN